MGTPPVTAETVAVAFEVPQLAVDAFTVADVIPATIPTLNVVANVQPLASCTDTEWVPDAKPAVTDVVDRAPPSIEKL